MSSRLGKSRELTFDWPLTLIVLALCGAGLVNLYSACIVEDTLDEFVEQIVWILVGCGAAAFVASQDYRHAERWSWLFYGGTLFLLCLVPLIGTEINGSQRWINFGPAYVQPSELMKIGIILVTARYFHELDKPEGVGLVDLIVPFGLLAVPSLLIFTQPDLGTTLTIALIFGTMLLFERIRGSALVVMGVTTVITAPLAYLFLLHDYQRARVMAFLDPSSYQTDNAYQVIQANIAIGSGGFFGKGYLRGTQVQNGFVPYHMNDFVFVHHGEQFGFVGSVALILLYFALIIWALRVARLGRDRFAVLCAVGVAALFFWHVVINLGMVMGLLPVVGLWLPFASSGGSSMLTVFIAVGLLMSVSMRRYSF